MTRKSLVSLVAAALLGVGIVGFTAPGPTAVGHLAAPPLKICGVCVRGL